MYILVLSVEGLEKSSTIGPVTALISMSVTDARYQGTLHLYNVQSLVEPRERVRGRTCCAGRGTELRVA